MLPPSSGYMSIAFYLEGGGATFVRNGGTFLPDYSALGGKEEKHAAKTKK
jgi:hypothetical protein